MTEPRPRQAQAWLSDCYMKHCQAQAWPLLHEALSSPGLGKPLLHEALSSPGLAKQLLHEAFAHVLGLNSARHSNLPTLQIKHLLYGNTTTPAHLRQQQ